MWNNADDPINPFFVYFSLYCNAQVILRHTVSLFFLAFSDYCIAMYFLHFVINFYKVNKVCYKNKLIAA